MILAALMIISTIARSRLAVKDFLHKSPVDFDEIDRQAAMGG
jgi:hypothetical protein